MDTSGDRSVAEARRDFEHLILIDSFLGELRLQCVFGLMAIQLLSTARTSEELWFALQSLLTACANISKVCWGSGGKKELERAAIRDRIGIADESVLRDPDLRNDFEHFDERLVAWHEDDPTTYIGRTVMPHEAVVIDGENVERRFHNYDPKTTVVTFWQHAVSIRDLADELNSLLPAVEQAGERLDAEQQQAFIRLQGAARDTGSK